MAPDNITYEKKALKKIVLGALHDIPGLLGPAEGLFGGFIDSRKTLDEISMSSGVSFSMKDGQAVVVVRMIAELDQSIPVTVDEMTDRIRDALLIEAGIETREVTVDVTDVMTREEYESRFRKDEEEVSDTKE